MPNPTSTPTALQILEGAARSAAAGLGNATTTRRIHPSYGVTKADLRQRYARLEGMLYAYWVAAHSQAGASVAMQAWEAANELDIDLFSLTEGVEQS